MWRERLKQLIDRSTRRHFDAEETYTICDQQRHAQLGALVTEALSVSIGADFSRFCIPLSGKNKINTNSTPAVSILLYSFGSRMDSR